MKILIPNYRTADSFVDNVASTLEVLGHDVETMPQINQAFHENKVLQLYRIIEQNRKGTKFVEQEKWLEKRITQTKIPDVIICLTLSLKEELLLNIQQKGIVTIAWWGDSPGNMVGKGLLCKGWDFIYIKDRNAANKMRGLGLNASLLHEAMNPLWHKPLYTEINDKLLIAGSFYDYRNYLVNQMIDRNIKVELHGRKLPKWIYPNIKRHYTNKFIVKEEKSKHFGTALACVNSTAMKEFDSLNCRAFEIAGTKGLQFFEYRPAIEECFEIDKEIKIFNTLNELEELYYWALKYPKEALKVREAGYKRALAEHTYEKRILFILEQIN